MPRWLRVVGRTCAIVACSLSVAHAQPAEPVYAGLLVGAATLSADARAASNTFSLYEPRNGLAVSAFAGLHLTRFFSVQANYTWNRNDLRLVSSALTGNGNFFYEQERRSQQHIFGLDTLLFVRNRASRVRPYLSGGVAMVRFASHDTRTVHLNGLTPPGSDLEATQVAVRAAVGIDIRLGSRSSLRYTYSDTLSRNPISNILVPRGERRLANFHNLVGVVWRP
jgi:hypothetical protein